MSLRFLEMRARLTRATMLGWSAGASILIACSASNRPRVAEDLPRGGETANGGGFDDTTSGRALGGDPCTTDRECADGVCHPTTKTCGCGGAVVDASAATPNVLIVLDRSCSMTTDVNGESKWEIAVGALAALVHDNQASIHFGLELFPDTTGANCEQDALLVPISAEGYATIDATLNAALSKSDPLHPSAGPCVTNIDSAVVAAASDPTLTAPGQRGFLILITDGKQAGCKSAGGDSGTTSTLATLHARGIDTFVVGFGKGVDPTQLDAFAAAGGQASTSGATKFFQAEDRASLDAALGAIVKRSLGCTLTLSKRPEQDDPARIEVFVGPTSTPLARDATHAGGWDYDATGAAVTLYGAVCDQLKAGTLGKVEVVLACASATPETTK